MKVETKKFLILPVLFFSCALLSAQSIETADSPSNFSFFGGGEMLQPAYGKRPVPVLLLGTDLSHRFSHFYFEPSLELRGTISLQGNSVAENVVSAGFRLDRRYGRFVPYGTLLAGRGIIQFRSNSTILSQDDSVVYTYGGGVEILFSSHLGMFGEFQRSHWNLGNSLTGAPYFSGVGIAFHYN